MVILFSLGKLYVEMRTREAPRKKKREQTPILPSSTTKEIKTTLLVRYHLSGNKNINVLQISATSEINITNQTTTLNSIVRKLSHITHKVFQLLTAMRYEKVWAFNRIKKVFDKFKLGGRHKN